MPEKLAHKNLTLCMLNSFAVFLGVSANNRPVWTPLRTFFIMLALYALNVTTIYTSKLINVIADPPYQEQIDTIEEIIESGLPFGKYEKHDRNSDEIFLNWFIPGGLEEYHDLFKNKFPEDEIFHKLYNFSDAFLPTMENIKRVTDGKQVMLLNRIFVLSKSVHSIFAMPTNVISNPLEMVAEKGIPTK